MKAPDQACLAIHLIISSGSAGSKVPHLHPLQDVVEKQTETVLPRDY